MILFYNVRIKSNIYLFIKNVDLQNLVTLLLLYLMLYLAYVPYLRILLNESHLTNQHIEIVRMFLDSEFFINELSALAFYTHMVSLPLLNFVEIISQEELLRDFPKLYEDLQKDKMDT